MTDADFLLAVLKDRPGEWVQHTQILNRSYAERGCGLTVHSRAATLRSRGHNVECKLEHDWAGLGRVVSFYRLVLSEASTVSPRPWAASDASLSTAQGLSEGCSEGYGRGTDGALLTGPTTGSLLRENSDEETLSPEFSGGVSPVQLSFGAIA